MLRHQPPIDPADYGVAPRRWSVTQALLGRVQQPTLGVCQEGRGEGREASERHQPLMVINESHVSKGTSRPSVTLGPSAHARLRHTHPLRKS